MKYLKIIIIPILFIAMLALSCERDDICASSTPTTPSLIIDLLDNANPDNQKSVVGLLVVGVDNDFILPGFNIATVNQLILPLRTDADTTQFRLIKEASINDNSTPDDDNDDFIDGNEDIITINYTRREVYVSRACGFKTIFENVTLDIEEDSENWMLSTQSLTRNRSIEDETTAHFSISH
ncbi:DUF6452 family protein [uncultured Algibacter sp.]|uniref:DUF6452 family protein n=1 Tax=uncultured Algibacter sp. TaxID=298659 RepID=UPI0032162B11